MKTVTMTVRVPPDVLRALHDRAEAEGCSRSAIAARLLAEAVENMPNRTPDGGAELVEAVDALWPAGDLGSPAAVRRYLALGLARLVGQGGAGAVAAARRLDELLDEGRDTRRRLDELAERLGPATCAACGELLGPPR